MSRPVSIAIRVVKVVRSIDLQEEQRHTAFFDDLDDAHIKLEWTGTDLVAQCQVAILVLNDEVTPREHLLAYGNGESMRLHLVLVDAKARLELAGAHERVDVQLAVEAAL